jgi:single-strand DNA-binding protein
MGTLNRATVLGRLGKDPESSYTQGGKCVCSFSLATDEHFKAADGSKQIKTEWIPCVSWSKTAELAKQYLKKGSQVLVEGKIQTRSWDDKASGQKRYKTEIVVDKMVFVGGVTATQPAAAPAPNAAPQEAFQDSIPVDDMPF